MSLDINAYHRLHEGIQACKCCQHFTGFGWHKFKPEKHGNPKSTIWIVGTDPRKIAGNPDADFWRGASKHNLREPLEEATGRKLEEVAYFTDVVKCQRKGKSLNHLVCKNCVRSWLRRELVVLNPEYILALGPDAHAAVRQFEVPLLKRRLVEIKFMPHPSPANGNQIRETYGSGGWNHYRTELKNTLTRWLRG